MKVDILRGVFKRYEHFKSIKISISSEYDFSMYFALYLRIKNADFTGGLWWTVTFQIGCCMRASSALKCKNKKITNSLYCFLRFNELDGT